MKRLDHPTHRRTISWYAPPVYSANFLNNSPELSFRIWSRSILPSVMPRALLAGHNLSRCCFAKLRRADSLREICNGLACCLGKLTHLGVSNAPKKSTLSYANEHRSDALFEDLFWSALDRFRSQGALGPKKHTFRFKNKLLSLDSTTISLCLSVFPWARFRSGQGGC